MSRDLTLPRAPLFKAFDDLFDFDRNFYNFIRDEKDMYPYDINYTKDAVIITHNVVGINKEDLKITGTSENGKHYIVISGSSTDEITNKTYSVNSRLSYKPSEIDITKAKSELKNGILYITIPCKAKEEVKKENFKINID